MDYTVTVLMTGFVTHDVKRFILSRPEGFEFEPGQGVEIALDKEGWRDEGRPFTPTSLEDDQVIEFTIKGYPDHNGVTEQLMQVQAGDKLLMSKPFGTIRYKGTGIFIAAGAGVTPFLAILRKLAKEEKLEGNRLIFSNKTPADIIQEKELRAMLGDDVELICTREGGNDYLHTHVDKIWLSSVIDNFDQPFYVCGPPKFVESVNEALTELGAKPDALVFEE